MKRSAPLFFALLLTLILAGCGSTGKNFPVVHVDDIHNGVTSQLQILDWFGVPYKEGERNGNAMWTYQFDAYNAFGKDRSKELVIVFDKDNIVKAYRYASNMD